MAYEWLKKWNIVPIAWLIGTIFMSLGAGFSIASNSLWCILFLICSTICAIGLIRRLGSIQKRIIYVMEATLGNDFSYKFTTENVSHDEREINETLNRIVEHLEKLSSGARQNEAFLADIINLSDIGLAVADVKGDIRIHNDAALRLLDRPAFTNICQITENARDTLDIRRREITVNEKSFTLLTITDLTHKMQAVEVESWEKLTRVLTHEIMNSLTPIQSIAETMSGKTSDPEVTEAFETVSSSSRSLMQFVKNFREFCRLPEPRMKAQYLKPLLESCVRMGESYVEGKDLTVSITCFPPELMVYTDESLLRQVILNIVKNAIEANPTRIDIKAGEKADESVEIRISNDGEPIPVETAEQIFTPFFTTRESGSGIGLSLSRRIITHLGGTLSFKTHPITSFSIKI